MRPWRQFLPRLGVVALLLFVAACREAPTAPVIDAVISAAKGGRGPSVNAADPSEAPQGTTLTVRVLGSGFDRGSTFRWLLNGAPAPKIQTLATRYVSNSELEVDIEIEEDTEEDDYDIEVETGRGKKGVGVELFAVKKPGDNGPEFVITTTDLGTLEGRSGSRAKGIVSAPIRVVGGSRSEDGAFYWTPGEGMVELTAPAERTGGSSLPRPSISTTGDRSWGIASYTGTTPSRAARSPFFGAPAKRRPSFSRWGWHAPPVQRQ